jgi:hypothetical protein
MFERITNFFRPEDAQKKASVALARLLSQYEMDGIAYRNEITQSRRRSESRQLALGCWIIPFEADRPQILDFTAVSSAVTYDMRRAGVGVLTFTPIELKNFVIALPDKEGVWRFFECEKCHNSRIPGGWTLSGLKLLRLIELEYRDVSVFRDCIHDEANVPVSAGWNS